MGDDLPVSEYVAGIHHRLRNCNDFPPGLLIWLFIIAGIVVSDLEAVFDAVIEAEIFPR